MSVIFFNALPFPMRTMTRHLFFTFIVTFLTALPFPASAVETHSWLCFHGPKGDNKSPDTGLLKSWPEGGPKLLWTAENIGFGYSSVSVVENRIYTTGNIEKDGKTLSMITCLDLQGNTIWQNDNGPGLDDARRYPSARATPTIDGEFLYDETVLGQVGCFKAETGEKIWSRDLIADYDVELHRWARAESLLVYKNLVICTPTGKKACAVALDKRTGKTVWETPPSASEAVNGFVTPYYFEFQGLPTVAVFTEDAMLGLVPETGEIRFDYPFANNRKINATIPIYRDGFLFLTHGYGGGCRLLKLEKDGEKIRLEEVWHEKAFDNQHGGVVLVDDHVYGTGQTGSWCSIDFNTGEIGYRERSVGPGSIHYADGLLYGLSEKGKTVLLLKPEPKRYVEISRFELPREADGMSWAHPVVFGGRLYLRHAQFLYCYEVKE